MLTQDRNALLHQLEETQNTCERQMLLRRIWHLDRAPDEQQVADAPAPPPLALPVMVHAAANATFSS